MTKALDGIRVIDMTHNQAGPACAQILAWFGADVIKLETPGKGDIARAQSGDELFFLTFNANKRSLTLDLKSDEGKGLFRKLIGQSDVLLENFSPGALQVPQLRVPPQPFAMVPQFLPAAEQVVGVQLCVFLTSLIQFTFGRSLLRCEPWNTRYRSATPLAPVAVQLTVVQFCQPPVTGAEHVASSVPFW